MSIKITRAFHVTQKKQRHEMQPGEAPDVVPIPQGRVPRVARQMALAIRFDQLLHNGEVKDYATLAYLGHVTRARITQIMNLLLLAPDLQEELLHLPLTLQGRDEIHLAQLQPIALSCSWKKQRDLWRQLTRKSENIGEK